MYQKDGNQKNVCEKEGLWKVRVQKERKTIGVCLKVNQKVRRRMGGRASLAHRKFTWRSRINGLGQGREEGVNN